MSDIQSVQRAFEILEAIAQLQDGAQLGDIAKLTDLPKSTVSRMLGTLENIEAVSRNPHSGAGFHIGPAIARLLSQPSSLATLGAPALQQLVAQTGETATLSVMDGSRLLYISHKSDPLSNIQLRDWTGTHFPTLHVLSPGKIFLAFDVKLRQSYLTKPLERFTENSITTPSLLKQQLDQIRAQGYGWVREEFERGLAGVSAPVFDHNNKIVAALSLYGPIFRVPSHENEQEFSDLVVQTAADLTARLAGQTK